MSIKPSRSELLYLLQQELSKPLQAKLDELNTTRQALYEQERALEPEMAEIRKDLAFKAMPKADRAALIKMAAATGQEITHSGGYNGKYGFCVHKQVDVVLDKDATSPRLAALRNASSALSARREAIQREIAVLQHRLHNRGSMALALAIPDEAQDLITKAAAIIGEHWEATAKKAIA